MTMRMLMNFLVLLFLLAAAATASPKEASGTVIGVESGDVFVVAIEESDPRIGSEAETVKLADVSLPPVESAEGKAAKEFAENLLMNRVVWLDIDDESGDGRDPLGRLLCVVYMKRPDGGINLTHPFNKILVDEGFAEINDSEDDEFDPRDWWPLWVFINEVEANPADSDSDNEWVELYNDGEGDVDVGNWTLTTAGGTVVTIEPGSIIPVGGFLVVTAKGLWLRNTDETVILSDAGGNEVDRTPVLDDEDDDDYCWARHPDGGSEWVYIESSPGEPVPPIERAAATISDLADDDDMWLRWSDGYSPSGAWDVSDFLRCG
jgi:endonuclease YncB( thermonuclease family)